MPEMDDQLAEMIRTLEDARHAVQADLERLFRGGHWDEPALAKVEDAVRTLAKQADSVFLMMIARDWTEPLMDRAESLVDFFQETTEQIVLKRSRSGSEAGRENGAYLGRTSA